MKKLKEIIDKLLDILDEWLENGEYQTAPSNEPTQYS